MNQVAITPQLHVGGDAPCFILAEVGINHNGDRKLAEDMIAAAAESGAHGVKFQNYYTEDFISDRKQTYTYISQGRETTESMFKMFKRYEIDREFVGHMKLICDRYGVVFASTPTSQRGIDDLVAAGAQMLKNGSDYLTNLDIIRRMAETRLPTVLSCGMSNLADVDESVQTFNESGNDNLILLHCTSTYPTPPADVHLRKMQSLYSVFGIPCGLSDHTEGIVAACLAASVGACMIEKHFTLDRGLPGPDHRFSCNPSELKALVDGVSAAQIIMGDSRLGPTADEVLSQREYRPSCVARSPLSAGHKLQLKDVAYKRPGTGVPPNEIKYLLNRRLKKNLPEGTILGFEHFE